MATSVTLKPNAIDISGSTSGTTTLQASAVAGTTTLTLPAATDTLVGKATTDTLTNKTLTGAAMNGTLGATTPSTASVTTLTTSSTVTHSGGTANGVAYLDGSKVLTTGSALVFDGTNLGLGGTNNSYGSQTTMTLSGTNVSRIDFRSNSTFTGTILSYQAVTEGLRLQTEAGYPITFYPAGTERARITSGGDLLVGTTGLPVSNGRLSVSASSGETARLYQSGGDSLPSLALDKSSTTNTTSQVFAIFTINNQATGSGQINANGASQAAFGSFSDRRLKENIVDLSPQLANIMALRPVEFDYIESEGGGHQISFVAQEFEQVYPDAIGERADGMKTLTGWGKTEARLVKAIQEQQAIIQSLTARITALEGA